MDDLGTSEQPRRRLGRGLNALLGMGSFGDSAPSSSNDASEIHVELIERNPYQPRQEFDSDEINHLTDSVRQRGVLQPLLVRQVGDCYQLIAGERRLIAAKRAGLEQVPCRVMQATDQELYEIALDENLNRADLNVIEKATAFHDYLQRFQCPIEELARRMSLDRSTVSNTLRLLELPPAIQAAVRGNLITAGHARPLLGLPEAEQTSLAATIQSEHWSVRKTEEHVRTLQPASNDTIPFPGTGAAGKPQKPTLTNHLLSLQEQLREWLGAKVEIKLKGKEAGKIVIDFASNDDFERLLTLLRKAA